MTDLATHRERILRAIGGDREAQQELFLEYYDLMAAVAVTAWPDELKGELGREDLIQQIVARALRKLPTYDPERLDEFPGWLKAVARSEIGDLVKRYRTAKRGGEARRVDPQQGSASNSLGAYLAWFVVTRSTPSRRLELDEARVALERALTGLPAAQREVIERKYFQGQPTSEIAAAMQRTTGAVRELLRRAESNLEGEMGSASHWLSRS